MLLNNSIIYQIITLYIPLAISVVFFLLALYAYIWKPKLLNKVLKIGIGAVFLWYIIKAGYFTWLQYNLWQKGDLSKFFLPPYQPITYFISYSWTHFFMKIVWLFGGAGVLGSISLFLNSVLKKKAVESINIKLVIFGSLVVGWPQMIIFFIVTLIMSLFVILFYAIIYKQEKSITLTPFFFASILITFFLGDYLVTGFGLSQLIV